MQHPTKENHARRKTWVDRENVAIKALRQLKIILGEQVARDLYRDPYLLAAVETFLESQSLIKKNSLFARLLTVNDLYTQGHLTPFAPLNIHSVNALTQFGDIHLEQCTAFSMVGQIIRNLPNQEVTCSNISETKEQVSIVFQCGDKTFTIILDAHLNRVIQANNIASGIESIHSALIDQSTHIDLKSIISGDTLQKVRNFLEENREHAKTSPQEVAKLSMLSRKTKIFSTKRFFAIPNYKIEFELDSISLPQGLMAHHENDTLFLYFDSMSIVKEQKLVEMLININNYFDLNLSIEALESHELTTKYPDIFQPKEIFLLEDDTVAMQIAIYYGAYQIDSIWYLPSKIILKCMPPFLQNYFELAGQDSEITPLTPDETAESKRDSEAEPADNDNIIDITTHGDHIYCHYPNYPNRRALPTQTKTTQASLIINIMGLPNYFQNKISEDSKFSYDEQTGTAPFYGENLQEHCKRHGHLLWVLTSTGSASTKIDEWHGVIPFNGDGSLTDECLKHCTSGDDNTQSPDFLKKEYKIISPHIIKDIARRPALRKLIQQYCSIVHSNKQTIIYTGNSRIYQALQNYDQSQFVRHYVFTCFMQTISLLDIELKEPQDKNIPNDISVTADRFLKIKYTNSAIEEINFNPNTNCRIISPSEYKNDILAILQQIEDTRQKKILSKIFSMNKQKFMRAINETPVNNPLLKMKKITQILRDGAATLRKIDKKIYFAQTIVLSTCMAGLTTACAGFSVIAGIQVSASLIKSATPLWTAALQACSKNPYCYLAALSILSAVIAAAIIIHLVHKQQTKKSLKSFYSALISKKNSIDSLGATTQNQSKSISSHVKSILLSDSEDPTRKCLTAVYLHLGGSIDGDDIENIIMKNDATLLLRSLLTSDNTGELSLLCPSTNIGKDDQVKVSSVTCSDNKITIQYTINKDSTVEKKISRAEIDNIINTSTAPTATS